MKCAWCKSKVQPFIGDLCKKCDDWLAGFGTRPKYRHEREAVTAMRKGMRKILVMVAGRHDRRSRPRFVVRGFVGGASIPRSLRPYGR